MSATRQERTGIDSSSFLDHTFGPDTLEPTLAEDRAGVLLAEGKMIVWDLYSPGLAVDGMNPAALNMLRKVKKIGKDNPDRPFVSMAPIDLISELVDINLHSQEVGELIKKPRSLINSDDETVYFGKFYAKKDLQEPIIRREETPQGELPTIVLLIHNNQRLNRLFYVGREHKRRLNGVDNFLITGSSANATGKQAPIILDDVDNMIMRKAATTIDLRTDRMNDRGRIAIIDFTAESPEFIREGISATPPVVQALLGLASL